MKKFTDIKYYLLSARGFVATLLVIGAALTAHAENRITVKNFGIKAGEKKVVPVNLENSDKLTSMQMDITLPEGISIVECKPELSRLEEGFYNIICSDMTQSGKRQKTYRVLAMSMAEDPATHDLRVIQGCTGAIFYLTLNADQRFIDGYNTLQGGSQMTIDGIVSQTGETEVVMEKTTAKISPVVTKLTSNAEPLNIVPDGTLYKVDFNLENYTTLNGVQAEIFLPKGIDIETNGNGMPVFTKTGRMPPDMGIQSNTISETEEGKTIRFLAVSFMGSPVTGSEGTLFSFNVKGDENLAEKSEIVIGNLTVSYKTMGWYSDEEARVVVNNIGNKTKVNDDVYKKFCKALADCSDSLKVANDSIAKTYPDAVDFSKAVSDKIEERIAFLTDSVRAQYEAVALTEESTLDTLGVHAMIKQMIEDAKGCQAEYDAIKANEEAYKRLKRDIKNVENLFETAKMTIMINYASVASDFISDIQKIQNRIDELTDSVETEYKAVRLTAESKVNTPDVENMITRLLEEVKKAAGTTGIDSVGLKETDAVNAEVAEIYTIDGKRVSDTEKGRMYIVKYAGGRVRKLFIK